MPTYRLTKKIEIIRKAAAPSDIRYPGDATQVVTSAWAQITPLQAAERVQSDQLFEGATHRIIFRWPEIPIDAEMRIRVNQEDYPILGLTDLNGDGKYIEAICSHRQLARGTVTTR